MKTTLVVRAAIVDALGAGPDRDANRMALAKRGHVIHAVADAEAALERAAALGEPCVMLLDASQIDAATLIEARTQINLSEQALGLVIGCVAEHWDALDATLLGGVELIRFPLDPVECGWRIDAAIRQRADDSARRARAREGERQALARAVRLVETSPDPVRDVALQLSSWLSGAAVAIARWRGEGRDLFDAIELVQVGAGRVHWSQVRAALKNGEARIEARTADAAGLSMFIGDAVPLAFAALPIGTLAEGQRGALVAWGDAGWDAVPGLNELFEIAAARLGFELTQTLLRERSRRQGMRDSLTRLANRAQFHDRLEEAVKSARASDERIAVMLINLDRFKTLNEAFGHAGADQVLVELARRIRQTVRGNDIVARYSGDEFALVLRELRVAEDALTVAAKLRNAVSQTIAVGEQIETRVTASIGVCHFPDDGATAEDLIRHADIAMRAGKTLGRNQTHSYVADLRETQRERVALEGKLRDAEARGEFRVFFQPQIDATSEEVIGVEALIRWQNAELGMVSPGFFIPVAEETGLIVPIGRFVLFEAARQVRRWQLRFGIRMRVAVNLSAVQLGQRELVDEITAALVETGLPPETLELEVTESVSVKHIPHLIETLTRLREIGCQIAIDDFGTGQSSLDYIRRFPADRIKIDQVFVRNIGVDPDDEAIVRATVGMAHSLGRQVVAEGVELEQHAEFLREVGCDELQGYLFCRPLPAAALENLLTERERLLQARR